jgi:glycosyltransferase involved in cell wall biosynthesis
MSRGGAEELIESTGGGFIYKTEAELASAMDQLAVNASLRQELGQKARTGFEKYYTKQYHLDGYLGLIQKIQKRKPSLIHST